MRRGTQQPELVDRCHGYELAQEHKRHSVADAGLPCLVPTLALRAAMMGMPTPAASMRQEKSSWFATG